VHGESLFFIRQSPGAPPTARLLFPPTGLLRLTSATREVEYANAADYLIDAASGIVTLPAGSRIPFMERAALYPQIGQEHCMAHLRGDEKTGLFFSEGRLFHDRQVEAGYEHRTPWKGFAPAGGLDLLPALAAKLGGAEPLKICIIGDSISTGCNASAYIGAPPRMPPYVDLWAEAIRRRHAGEVALANFAVSGTGMKYGMAVVEKAMDEKPDLVVIAYGMNDVGFIPLEEYVRHATRLLDAIKARDAGAEVILIATMLGNPEWEYTPAEKTLLFRDALAAFRGPGVALADMTSLWADLLKVKSYQDLTGNGVNHPNDFGHRLYAQVLMELLGISDSTR
jgi:lysophospholipase L1-like esterase